MNTLAQPELSGKSGPPRSFADVLTERTSPSTSVFQRFWQLGYRELLPVVPPAAKIRDAGKRPGVHGPHGWYGQSAASFDATPELIAEWAAMGAGVGLRCHNGIIGLDFDTTSPRWSKWVHETALRILGPAKRRIGRAPKGLLPYRTTEPLTYRQCRFDDDMDPKKPGLVELLAGETKWFVVDGIHPATGAPYRWPDGIPNADDLTTVTPAQIDEFFSALAAELPRWRGAGSSSNIDRASVDQASLAGDPDRIRRAMEALPNTPDLFGYHEWLRVAVALRAALPHDEALGLELFEDWTEKGDIAEPRENAARVFWSVDPPFGFGAKFLEDLAVQHSGGAFTSADRYFDPQLAKAAGAEIASAQPFDFTIGTRLSPAETEVIAPRQFVLGTRFMPGVLTLGTGPGGVSKSTFAILSALAIASDKPLTGEYVARPGPVLIYSAEDPRAEMTRRVMAIARVHGIPSSVVHERVHVLSGFDDLRLVFAERRTSGGPVQGGAEVERLADFVRDRGIVFTVLDPLIALHRGLEENSAADMEALGDRLRHFAKRSGAAVDLIHHTVKNGRAARSDQNAGVADAARGSSAIINLVRSGYTLYPMSDDTGGKLGLPRERIAQMVRLDDSKRNYARRAARERWFELVSALPTGERIAAGDFEAVVPAIAERANSSVGVHVRFDVNRQRALAAMSKAGAEDVKNMELLRFVVSSMTGDETPRKTILENLMAELGMKETTARTTVNDLVPEERKQAVEVEVDGWVSAVWRELRPVNGNSSWIVLRSLLRQSEASAEEAFTPGEADAGEAFTQNDDQNGGVFG